MTKVDNDVIIKKYYAKENIKSYHKNRINVSNCTKLTEKARKRLLIFLLFFSQKNVSILNKKNNEKSFKKVLTKKNKRSIIQNVRIKNE